jgi:AbrB family looped-hinge helix DNA binding protein
VSEAEAPYGTPRARLTRQGQITVPRAVRDALGLAPGDDVAFERRGQDIVLRRRRRPAIMDFAGLAAGTAPHPCPVDAELERIVEDQAARAYGDRLERWREAVATGDAHASDEPA